MDKSVLRKALADSEDPTPGYLFRDIAQMTFVDPATQGKLLWYLLDKLTPASSVHVLAKALNVIKHLCNEGHTDFQKEMQRRSDALKPLASYRGIPDPKYGDKLNERVRTMAREAIEAAFSHRRETKTQSMTGVSGPQEQPAPGVLGSGIIGSAAGAIGAAATFAASTVGYGAGAPAPLPVGATERMAPMPTTNKWAEEMAKKQAAAAGGSGIFSSISNVKAAVGLGGSESIKSKQERMLEELNRGSAGFQAIELPSQGFSGAPAAPSSGGWKFVEQQEAAPAAASAAPAVKVLTVFEREVEKLATMKSVPQRVELGNFHQAVTALANQRSDGWEELAAAMDAQLAAKVAWQARLNVLTALEFILRPDSNCGPALRAYFVENPEDVQRNVHVVQTSLKEKAQKVLRQLGIPERTAEAAAAPAAPAIGAMGNTWMASMPAAAPAPAAGLEPAFEGAPTFDGMVLKRAAPASGSGAAATAAREAVDKTKLKKRGQMSAMADEPAPTAPSTGFAAPAAFGAGFTDNAPSAGWGSDAGWGAPASAGWGDAPAAAPTAPAWGSAAPAAQAATASTLDALFGAPSAPPAAAAPATVPAPSFAESAPAAKPTQDTLAALGLAPTSASAPLPPPAPAPAAPVVNSGTQQLQQQLMMQCQALSAQFMAAVQRGDSAAAQQLMAQQQMLMAQMATLQQPAQSPNTAFAALAADARRM